MSPNRRFVSWALGVAAALAFVVGASAQQIFAPQDPQPPPQQQQQEPEQQQGRGGRGNQPPAPRPYNQVITSAAKTDDGIFKVHRIGESLYYEIPKAQLNKDFLWNMQIKKTTIGAGYGGQNAGSRVVRWVTKGDRVLLLNIDYTVVADPVSPVAMAVDDANYPTIIRAFNVAAYAPSGDPVIDVTTAIRQHPGESLLRYASIVACAGTLGIGVGAFAVYRVWSALNGLVEHANVRMPRPRRAARVLASKSLTCQSMSARTTVAWNCNGPKRGWRRRARSTACSQNGTARTSSGATRPWLRASSMSWVS